MNRDPKYLLFKEARQLLSGETSTLFKSQRELAKAIEQLDSGYDAATLEPFLSQIFKAGGVPGSKPIPQKLLNAIISLSQEKLLPEHRDVFREEMELAFHTLKKENLSLISVKDLWIQFNDSLDKAPVQHIFAQAPIELKWHRNAQAALLLSRMCKNLNLTADDPQAKSYHFYVPRLSTALELWGVIYHYLSLLEVYEHSYKSGYSTVTSASRDRLHFDTFVNEVITLIAESLLITPVDILGEEKKTLSIEEKTLSEVVDKIDILLHERNIENRLTITVLDEKSCIIPLTFLEMGKTSMLFSTTYYRNSEYNLMRYSNEDAQFWYQNFFLPITTNINNSVTRTPVAYRAIRNQIAHSLYKAT